MTKADLTSLVYEQALVPRKDAAKIVDLVFGLLAETLEKGENVKISGFGKFTLLNKRARIGRNPLTGVEIEIAPRRVLTFKASGKLREAMRRTPPKPAYEQPGQ